MEKQIAKKLYLRRCELRLSLKEVAKRIGITEGAVSHLEVGRRFPKFETLKKWVDTLGMDIDIEVRTKQS